METTNDFNERKYLTGQEASLAKENLKLRKRIKNERIVTHLSYLVIIAILIILFCRKCDGYERIIEAQGYIIDALKDENSLLLNELKNQKAVLNINEDGNVLYVSAVISDVNDPRPSEQVVRPIKVPYRVSVPTVDSSAIMMAEDCAKANDGLIALLAEKDDLLKRVNKFLDNSIETCVDKQYRQDSSVVLVKERFPLRSFLSDVPPSINYSHTYIEYLPNPYREKAEKNFRWGVGFAGGAVALYGISEALGHPKFRDDIDNSDAEKKHNQILSLRIGSGVLAAASMFEFGRTIYFHKMEGKFIVDPTKFGLVLYLDK
ncbi:MAG TPA: hypothetical protein VK153_00455 [Candidatus Paceibacterota bacterium]|nr:hypothetical protein [Candidatus Paceibacterota bacterium]